MHFYDTSAYNIGRPQTSARCASPNPGQLRCCFATPGFAQDNLAKFPADSFALSVDFKLVTPYISKDDVDPTNTDPTIVREWVYRIPMVRPTTWKGRLRFSAAQTDAGSSTIAMHLFGPRKDAENPEEGRLHFFPTFFESNAEGNEVINPHNRTTRRGTVPVTLKCVKEGTVGKFCLLYLGPTPTEFDPQTIQGAVVSWVREMIELHGIGGKTLKGFGLGSISEYSIITEKDKTRVKLGAEGNPQ
jgi:CRISPR-associated protein Cmr2